MPPRNSKNRFSDEDLLDLVKDEKRFKAERTDVYKFYINRNLKPGRFFYSTSFLYHLYKKEELEEITKTKFVQILKLFLPYKRKNLVRGFLLQDLKIDILDLYKSVTNEKKEKKNAKRLVTEDNTKL